MKRCTLFLLMCCLSIGLFANGKFKDVRQTYLWDVTLSMKGYGGAPNIYDAVVDVMIKDIESINNERTEIVVVPFQDTKYCEVWRELATPAGKKSIIEKIRKYDNAKITHTNISEPLNNAMEKIFSSDKIDILKLMTDGNDNVDPDRLEYFLNNWCEIAKQKDVYGYYILLTDAAKNSNLSLVLKTICNFEEIDASHGLTGIAEIRQINSSWNKGILLNIRDEYNKPKRLQFNVYSGDGIIPAGFKIHFKTKDNPYVDIDEIVEMKDDNSVVINPHFKMSQAELINSLPTDCNYDDIVLEYEPTSDMATNAKFKFTRLVDNECTIMLENKPVKTVKIHVKNVKK